MSMFLTAEELAAFTTRKTKSKQIEALRRMGVPFYVTITGHPKVACAAIVGNGNTQPAPPPKKAWVPRVLKKG